MDRRITITSEPPGALVWLNDAEVGRTPVSTRFTWYGKYDVQLRLEGHEPIVTSQRAKMPVYEAPPLDLVASALPIRTELRWHYVLEPLAPEGKVSRTELLERARAFREGLEAQSP